MNPSMNKHYCVPLSEDETMVGKTAQRAHVSQLIQPGTIIFDQENDSQLIIFGRLNQNNQHIKNICSKIKFKKTKRVARIVKSGGKDFDHPISYDKTFGFRPRREIFGLPSGASDFNSKYPDEFKKLIQLGVDLEDQFKTHAPDKYLLQMEIINHEVHKNWMIPGTIFTQGIINNSNNLDYHFDRGNFKGFWSCMAVFAKDIVGGQLVIPSLNCALNIQDNTYVLFNGQKHLHGVTKINKTSPQAFRFSIVFYALELMKFAKPTVKQELDEIRSRHLTQHKNGNMHRKLPK